MGLTTQVPENVRFYEGDQWVAPTEKTKNMPRPVINITKMVVRNKKSGILSSKLKLNFRSEADADRSEKLTAFNAWIEKEMNIQALRERMVESGTVKGSAFRHYYWDADAKGIDGVTLGGVRAEEIDILNIFFHNPLVSDIQKQKWILIASRVEVDTARKMAEKGVDKTLIQADNHENDYGEVEQGGSELCTVLTRYFRKNGEVYFERATKNCLLHKPMPITPNVTESEDIDEKEIDTAEEGKSFEEDEETSEYRATRYPVVAYQYETREKSIYGRSEVEGLIPNQKAINFLYGMQLLAVQNTAWGKYIVRRGALNGQKITNEPGQVLVDNTPEGNGIRKLNENSISGMPNALADSLMELTRQVSGATEVMTGETIGKNQSGAAIAQLQSQALKPIDDLRKNYWRAEEEGGLIVEQFYKLYYENKPYYYEKDDEQMEDIFNGKDYQDTEFSVVVEAGAGTQFSEAMTISLLEGLFQAQQIDLKTFVDLYPDNAMPFKEVIKKEIKAREESENTQLKMMVAQYQQAIEQMQAQLQQQGEIVDKTATVIRENRMLNEYLAKLQDEYTTKINQANMILGGQQAKIDEVTDDAAYMANELFGNNAKSVSK
ncbi:MAG: hypothetical protein IJ981_03160 [Clostridia bacterium]|nr:hypothetical protein [Clostridia bacterium]